VKLSKFHKEGQKRRNKLHATGSRVSMMTVELLPVVADSLSSGSRQLVGIRGGWLSATPLINDFCGSVLLPIYCSLLGLFWGLVGTFKDSLDRFSLGLALKNSIKGK